LAVARLACVLCRRVRIVSCLLQHGFHPTHVSLYLRGKGQRLSVGLIGLIEKDRARSIRIDTAILIFILAITPISVGFSEYIILFYYLLIISANIITIIIT
jgi:hypothetical protein